ncbi:MAG: ECF transporter S component [Cellulosilyticaceae bacterium]
MQKRKVFMKMNEQMDVRKITLVGLGIALNVIGALIALNLRLPVYLDSVGTVMVACVLGSRYAVMTGLGGSLISGMTFDIYSLYFAPVQITTGMMAGMMFQKGMLKGGKTPLGVLVMSLPTAFVSAVISAFIFGGVTSSGSSYVVQILKVIGFSDVLSVFVTQMCTDYLDEYIGVLFVMAVVKAYPNIIKHSRGVS